MGGANEFGLDRSCQGADSIERDGLRLKQRIRRPDVRAERALKDGPRAVSILRGAQGRAPQDDADSASAPPDLMSSCSSARPKSDWCELESRPRRRNHSAMARQGAANALNFISAFGGITDMAELTAGMPRSRMTQNGPAAQIAAANTRGKGSFRISRAMTRPPRAVLKRRDIVFLLSI